ncbi:MAG TPA: hypothetical protein VFN81_08470 [Sphingomicrobium sp.]|jgi:hypothetical protein|nr:hypothetical protein [Sphingomicrobium sp.]
MASDPLANVRLQVATRVAEIRNGGPHLSPLDLYAKMDAIRQLAVANGLATLEGLARCSAQLALLPGHRIAVQSCLEHVEDAIESRCETDCSTILAALAVRLH